MNKYFETGKEIIRQLKEHKHDAYFVGGFVRDRVLNIESKDIDITTSATPEEVISIFSHVKETGKKYGTVTVLKGDYKFEVTTYRSDGEYLDNRRPETVTYSKQIQDDLSRRDFTINALVMDEFEEVTDYYHGIEDINNKLIRTINDPLQRFQEDALRLLRAFRFVSKLGFDIEPNTLEAIKVYAPHIKDLAIERVMIELSKIVKGQYRQKAMKYMSDTGVSKQLYGLDKGIEFCQNSATTLYPLEFFILSFILGDFNDVWKFSNHERRVIEKTMILHEVTKEDEFNKFIVYVNKLDGCLLANKINVLLGYKDQEEAIRTIHKELPIHDVCDLVFKGQDIIWLTELRKKSWIGLIVDDIKYNVIMGYLPNEYEPLKAFALEKVKELLKQMGEDNE